jgi:DNA-binding NarL/FixJ family response regulator
MRRKGRRVVEQAEPTVTRLIPPSIRIVIADDQRLVRTGLRVILEREADLTVVGEASDSAEAVAQAHALKPDVILMDIRMPHMDGLHASRKVLSETTARVVILTTFDSDEYVYESLRAGASGFLLKDAPAEHLIAAIRCAASGDALIDPTVTRRLVGTFTRALQPAVGRRARLAQLTARELDILKLIGAGLNNAEIARDLVIEESTVKTHVSRILAKLAPRDRVQAVVLAYDTGLITPERSAEPD